MWVFLWTQMKSMNPIVLLLVALLAPAAGFQLATVTSSASTAASTAASTKANAGARSTHASIRMVQRSKEAQANIDKWGKILSQADTFDESKYGRRRKPSQSSTTASKAQGQAAGGIVVAVSVAAVVAMALAA